MVVQIVVIGGHVLYNQLQIFLASTFRVFKSGKESGEVTMQYKAAAGECPSTDFDHVGLGARSAGW